MKFNKLIRDNIPEIIKANGNTAVIEVLDDNQYFEKLNNKLTEEINEYNQEYDINELVDVLEVIYAISAYRGIDINELEEMRKKKSDECGGFTKKINLIEVI